MSRMKTPIAATSRAAPSRKIRKGRSTTGRNTAVQDSEPCASRCPARTIAKVTARLTRPERMATAGRISSGKTTFVT
jgi:hypothetical protein